MYWAKGSVSFLGICSFVPMTLLILSEGLSTFEMWGNHSEEFMCVNEYLSIPSWMEFSTTKALQIPKKLLGLFQLPNPSNYFFRRNKKPDGCHVFYTLSFFFAASKKSANCKRPEIEYRGTSRPIKRRVCGCPWSDASRGKNGWERENPFWDGGPRWNNQPHEYTRKLTWRIPGRSPLKTIGITSTHSNRGIFQPDMLRISGV